MAPDGVKVGSSVTRRCKPPDLGSSWFPELSAVAFDVSGSVLIKRCRSSGVSSSSDCSPSSNVSARVLSASAERGSSENKCLEAGDDALERKEGGGEDGTGEFIAVSFS